MRSAFSIDSYRGSGRQLALGCSLLLLGGGASLQAELVNRWSFNNPAGAANAGTTLLDSVSGAAATVQGNFSELTGTRLRLQGSFGDNTTTGNRSANSISGYLDLPNGMISSKTHLSVELWATPLSVRTYERIFDFGRITGAGSGGGAPGEIIDIPAVQPGLSSASDNLFLSFCVGDSLDNQRMEALLNGGSKLTADTALATDAGTQYHYVLTFEDLGPAGGRITW